MKIAFENRELVGKNLDKLRKNGKIPVVCYGSGVESKPYSIDEKSMNKFLLSDEVLLETDGDIKNKKVILQDIYYHPVTENPMHADFIFVDESVKVVHEVSIQIVGEAPAVKLKGGQMVVAKNTIEIEALPQNIPSVIEVDISKMEDIGNHLYAKDINLSNGVELKTNEEEIIVSIVERVEEKEKVDVNIEDIGLSDQKGKKDDTETEEGKDS